MKNTKKSIATCKWQVMPNFIEVLKKCHTSISNSLFKFVASNIWRSRFWSPEPDTWRRPGSRLRGLEGVQGPPVRAAAQHVDLALWARPKGTTKKVEGEKRGEETKNRFVCYVVFF